MSKCNDGGPAFPTGEYEKGTDRLIGGMTLRDYFAAKALQALVQIAPDPDEKLKQEAIARWSYQIADAMLAERG